MPASVALISCTNYDLPRVRDAVSQAIDLLGGISSFVKPGQRVLIKPNLLRASAPDEAVCTHPSVVQALVELVQEAGAHAVIGDSPGGPTTAPWIRAVYWTSGMTKVAEATGAELNWDFTIRHIAFPEGRQIKGLDVGTFVRDADVVIAVPKLKTHGFMQFTGATKILFGAIPGTGKLAYHAKFPEPEAFGDALIDILQAVKPALMLMDSIVGMDGEGPSAGRPFPIGAVLASTDAVALDIVAATLVGMDVHSIYPLRAAIARGMSSGRVEEIALLGDGIDTFLAAGFRPPRTDHRKRHASKALASVMRYRLVAAPRSNDRCVGCGVCAQNCPAQAITIVSRRAQMDLSKCIRCYCCHELCPHQGIDLKKPWLGRLLSI